MRFFFGAAGLPLAREFSSESSAARFGFFVEDFLDGIEALCAAQQAEEGAVERVAMFFAVAIAASGVARASGPRFGRAALSIESGAHFHGQKFSWGKQKQGPRGQELHVNSLAAGRGPHR